MEFNVLGPIEAIDGDRVVPLGSRMPKAVIAVLLLEPGRVVSLDRLIDLLWAGEPPAAATAALQVYVSGLRRGLEPDRPARTPPAVLVTQPPGYALRVNPHCIDAVRFEDIVGAGRASVAAGDPASAQQQLRSALALWRGEPYTKLQEARHVLGEELGIDPGPSLRRLEDGILQQSPSLDVHSPAVAVGATVAPAAAPPAPPDRLLVGRDDELAQLVGVLEGVVSGNGRVALVAGEPGIGKTRLVEELAAIAGSRGQPVAWGRCHEGGASPAYWPWVQIIRSLCHQADSELVRRALATGAEELAQIVPDVKEVAGRELAPIRLFEPEEARTRLYDAVIDFVTRLAADDPLVLVIDDLHWADPASVHLVCLLAARIPETTILLVCTYRDFEGDLSESVRGALGVMARVPEVARVHPSGLSEEDVGRLVAGATGGDTSADLAAAICTRTEGNPFFVSELVQLLQSERQLNRPAGEAVRDSIPSGVRDVIRLRLARLPDDTVSLLRLAAVAGRDFDLDVVAAAAGVDDDTAFERVEASLLIGLVTEHAVLGRYRFSHSLVRESLYQELSAARRARLHRALGEVLARSGDESHTLDIAHHFYEAAPLGRPEEAYEWALRAAERAGRLLAFEQVEEELNRAMELARAMPHGPEAARRQLTAQTRLGTLLLMTRGYSAPEAGEAWAQAVATSREAGDAPDVITAMWETWSFACVRGDFSQALSLAEELLARGRAE